MKRTIHYFPPTIAIPYNRLLEEIPVFNERDYKLSQAFTAIPLPLTELFTSSLPAYFDYRLFELLSE